MKRARNRDSHGHYRLLGVPTNATEEQIQLAYEHLEELPPGQRRGSWSQITRAYSVLSDPRSRAVYDRMETRPGKPERKPLKIFQDIRFVLATFALLVGILGFVWYPLYGDRFRTFAAGDQLVTVQGEPFGRVLQSKESHDFPSGAGPAYLVEMHGSQELRWFPAADIRSACRRAR